MAGCDTAKNTQIQFKSFVFNLNAFDFITRRATGFKPLRQNYWEINQTTSECQIDFWTKLAKKVGTRKKEYHYKILHIQISLGIKFRLKLTLLNIWEQNNTKTVFLK